MKKHELLFRSNEVFSAYEWYENTHGTEPSTKEFEKEFHCKILKDVIQFDNQRDYTYFILRWC